MIDRDGLRRAQVMCGTLMDAISLQIEDLTRLQHPRVTDLRHLDDAVAGLEQADSSLRSFLMDIQECAVCDGIIGDAARAEVVNRGGDGTHLIIHQSCFREADHEVA